MVAIVPIPTIAPPVDGYIRFRGQAIAVVDLAARLRLPARDISEDEHLIIVMLERRTLALRVDRVVGLGQCDDVPEPLETSAAPIAGVLPRDDGSLLVVDLALVLSLEERRSVEEAIRTLEGASALAP